MEIFISSTGELVPAETPTSESAAKYEIKCTCSSSCIAAFKIKVAVWSSDSVGTIVLIFLWLQRVTTQRVGVCI